MAVALVTGAAGLIGAETVRFFSSQGLDVVGIDNDLRKELFGESASTKWSRNELERTLSNYRHYDIDIRDASAVASVFADYGTDITVVVHTAAQPSHDWAARSPEIDFSVNATGTLVLLENTRRHCPDASFIFTSTNKVYGDQPNQLPFVEQESRWEIDPGHPYYQHGIDESMSVDQTTHSLFGVSKLAADAMVQEYGRYFGMNTVCFRGGCLTGPGHSGAMLHGFLAFLVQCAIVGEPYTILGYKGKQVRDNIHARDLVGMFWSYYQRPIPGAVFNAGGGRHSNCSVLEAITLCEEITGKKMKVEYSDQNRTGDHIWWISDTRKFQEDYPEWSYEYDLRSTMEQLVDGITARV